MTDFQFEIPQVKTDKPEKTFIAAHEILPRSTDSPSNRNDGRVFFRDAPDAYAPLDSVDLPGWTHQPRDPGLPPNVFVEQYTPPNAPPPVDGVQQVSLLVRGSPPVSDKDTAAGLRQLLTDHSINDKDAPYIIKDKDFDNMRGAFTEGLDIPSEFKKQIAWTRTIDNKRIAFVQGDYTHSDARALVAYIDANPQHPGQALVTASYVASKELFDKYLPQAKRAFESMRFNNKTQDVVDGDE